MSQIGDDSILAERSGSRTILAHEIADSSDTQNAEVTRARRWYFLAWQNFLIRCNIIMSIDWHSEKERANHLRLLHIFVLQFYAGSSLGEGSNGIG